ncbi:MAG: hypothetical protein KDC71_24385 [Acidobacteria bacterium]|nr:hypothetical protein [Acidobacteriota bacterium]
MNAELTKILNLLRQSPNFVMKENGGHGEAEIFSPEKVPDGSGICWVAGETILRNGVILPSVFQVDTNNGGTLLAAYWWIAKQWYLQGDNALKTLGFERKDAYPYDWKYHVKLCIDIYH